MRLFTTVFITVIFCMAVTAQGLQFERSIILDEFPTNSGVALGVADLNGDFLDDIIVTNNEDEVYAFYQNVNFDSWGFSQVMISNGLSWSLIAADYSGDGIADIWVNTSSEAARLKSESGEILSEQTGFLIQASNMIDVNDDGRLDVFICNDNGPSKFLLNKGDEIFEDSTVIDFPVTDTYDGSGNYGAVWSDVNNDGKPDLYIAKCRAGVSDPEDRRRINNLFINGDAGFKDEAEERSVAVGNQSWTADFGDYDNDGDMDLFITNHYADNQLFENDGNGFFTEISHLLPQVDIGFPIQSIWRDIDNDGLLDVIVTGSRDYIYHNNGPGIRFGKIDRPFSAIPAQSMAAGDFNADGRVDFLLGYATGFNNSSKYRDLVYENNCPSLGHYVTLTLRQNDVANTGAVGARVYMYTSQGIHTREVRAGESYGISNSLNIHLTTASNRVDSLHIVWPDRTIEKYQDVNLDQHYVAVKGECLKTLVKEIQNTPYFTCNSDTIRSSNQAEVLWNNKIRDSIIVPGLDQTTTGIIQNDSENCIVHVIPGIRNKELNAIEDTKIKYALAADICDQTEVVLTAPEGSNYIWSDQSTNNAIIAQESGIYSLTYQDACNDTRSAFVELDLQQKIGVPENVVNDSLKVSGTATLQARGAGLIWCDKNDVELARNQSSIEIDVLATDTFYVAQSQINFTLNNILLKDIGLRSFTSPNVLLEQFIDVVNTVRINEYSLTTAVSGNRSLIIKKEDGSIVSRDTFSLVNGATVIEPNLILEPGRYCITTDSLYNRSQIGSRGPQFSFTSLEDHGPLGREDGILWIGSSGTSKNIYGISDIKYDIIQECIGEKIPVIAFVDKISSIDGADYSQININVFPNPASDIISVFTEKTISRVRLIDFRGNHQLTIENGDSEKLDVDVSSLASGLYVLQVQTTDGQLAQTIIQKI